MGIVDDKWDEFSRGVMPVEITQCSTAINCITAIDLTQNKPIVITTKEHLKHCVENKIIDPNNLKRTESTHQGFLRYAKKHLISKILNDPFPSIEDKEIVILLMGTALNKQIDKTPSVKGLKTDGIISKLKSIDLNNSNDCEKKLHDDYKELNKYYNASKHEKESCNIKYEKILSTEDGRLITIHFFETVRKIFIWYYKKYASGCVPDWDELEEINYFSYGIVYDFNSYNLPSTK